jgi:hypothetical protein
MNQNKLRALEVELSTTGKTSRLLDCSRQRIWTWRKGADILKIEELALLEARLTTRLNRISVKFKGGSNHGS